MAPDRVFGFLNINKPAGPTSHDIVATVRRSTGVRKVGHAGTLDPMASGVLVLCLGPATRLSEYVMQSRKRYRATIRLGISTDTYDAEGEIAAESSLPDFTPQTIEDALEPFRGSILQVPPMYSAIKKSGKKLYELARAGREIEREPRPVTIYGMEILDFDPPDITLLVECSPGTYIRSLAHDLGLALGVGGHLAALERTASGTFSIESATGWKALTAAVNNDSWQTYLLPPDTALQDYPAVYLDEIQTARVSNGNAVMLENINSRLVRAYRPDGWLLALLEPRGASWQPVKVFPAAD